MMRSKAFANWILDKDNRINKPVLERPMHVSYVASFRLEGDIGVLYPTCQFLISNLDHVFVTHAQMMRSVQLWPLCIHLGH